MEVSFPKPWLALKNHDPEVFACIEAELGRQQRGIELIASENFASAQVVATAGNIMTNKYAEGLPKKRYYGGCEHVDTVEQLAIDRAKKIFGCSFANVQPHSGAQANAAVFLALLNPGDTILGLDLSHGGHLTHGSKVNFSGIQFQSEFYRLDPKTERLNYDAIAEKALECKPKVIIAGASAYSRTIDFARFREIADSVGAYLFVDMAHIAGLVAAGEHPSPIPYADVVTTTTHKSLRGPRGGLILWNREDLNFNKAVFPGTQGGPLEHIIAAKAVCFAEALKPEFRTYQKNIVENCAALCEGLKKNGFKLVSDGSDNHLCLIDLSESEVTGKQMEKALGAVEITVNKNTVPQEKRSPFVTSGIRLGTPAVTSRGMGPKDMHAIADLIGSVFEHMKSEEVFAGKAPALKEEVEKLALKFPLYKGWE